MRTQQYRNYYQKSILYKYATDHGFPNIRFFVDDGYTGTNFNRPAMQELLSLVKQGKVGTCICKSYWLIDEDSAPVVKHIFDLAMEGKGPESICRILESEKALTAKALRAQRQGKPLPDRPYFWKDSTIVAILERMEYTGCTCNFKTYSKSYKLKKRIPNKPEDMYIIPDTQEAIVSKEQWERVQELRKQRHRSIQRAERQGMFAGILFCADCGSRLHFCTSKSFEGKQDHYVCASYKGGRGDCTGHYIREFVLRDIVLERIRAVTAYVREDAEGFQEEWMQCRRDKQEQNIRLNQKNLERYQKMASDYEEEQEQLELQIEVYEGIVESQQEANDNYDAFAALVKKYVDIPELTQTIVNEFIKKIIVHAPEKINGKRSQKVEIIFNFVGEVEIAALNEPVIVESTLGRKKTA